MAKKTIRRSDGSWEVHEKRGFWYYTWWVLGTIFVLVMAVHTWWLGPTILALAILGLIGRRKG